MSESEGSLIEAPSASLDQHDDSPISFDVKSISPTLEISRQANLGTNDVSRSGNNTPYSIPDADDILEDSCQNPEPPKEIAGLINADNIGGTVFSKHWLFTTLMNLLKVCTIMLKMFDFPKPNEKLVSMNSHVLLATDFILKKHAMNPVISVSDMWQLVELFMPCCQPFIFYSNFIFLPLQQNCGLENSQLNLYL